MTKNQTRKSAMNNSILRELKSSIEYMSPVERRIADVILQDPKKFTSYSLLELSALADVSSGSIINFSNKFAGSGFSALKLEIAACTSDTAEIQFTNISETDTVKDVLAITVKNVEEALTSTIALNEENTLLSVVNLILNAKKVEIYGIFHSAIVATDFYYQLLQLGIPTSFVGDILTCAVSASMLQEDSLVIAISASGKTQEIIDSVKLAKENNVPVVCITGHKNSPLAKLSDEVLVAPPSGNSLSTSDIEIRTSQLTITDAICSYLQRELDRNGEKNYYRVNKILNSHNIV